MKKNLFLIWVLLLVNIVNAQFLDFTISNPYNFYLENALLIDFLLYALLFVLVGKKVLEDHFGDHVSLAMGFILALGLTIFEAKNGFNLGNLGPVILLMVTLILLTYGFHFLSKASFWGVLLGAIGFIVLILSDLIFGFSSNLPSSAQDLVNFLRFIAGLILFVLLIYGVYKLVIRTRKKPGETGTGGVGFVTSIGVIGTSDGRGGFIKRVGDKTVGLIRKFGEGLFGKRKLEVDEVELKDMISKEHQVEFERYKARFNEFISLISNDENENFVKNDEIDSNIVTFLNEIDVVIVRCKAEGLNLLIEQYENEIKNPLTTRFNEYQDNFYNSIVGSFEQRILVLRESLKKEISPENLERLDIIYSEMGKFFEKYKNNVTETLRNKYQGLLEELNLKISKFKTDEPKKLRGAVIDRIKNLLKRKETEEQKMMISKVEEACKQIEQMIVIPIDEDKHTLQVFDNFYSAMDNFYQGIKNEPDLSQELKGKYLQCLANLAVKIQEYEKNQENTERGVVLNSLTNEDDLTRLKYFIDQMNNLLKNGVTNEELKQLEEYYIPMNEFYQNNVKNNPGIPNNLKNEFLVMFKKVNDELTKPKPSILENISYKVKGLLRHEEEKNEESKDELPNTGLQNETENQFNALVIRVEQFKGGFIDNFVRLSRKEHRSVNQIYKQIIRDIKKFLENNPTYTSKANKLREQIIIYWDDYIKKFEVQREMATIETKLEEDYNSLYSKVREFRFGYDKEFLKHDFSRFEQMEAEYGYLLDALQRLRKTNTPYNNQIDRELLPSLEGTYKGYHELRVRLGKKLDGN